MSNTTDERRKILEMVANGDLSPSDAADLLAAVGSPGTTKSEDLPAARIRVVGTFRSLQVEGDESVAGARAEGPHKVREENGTLIFEEDPEDEESSYMLFGPRRKVHGRIVWGQDTPRILKIRMNPALPLQVEMTAGSATIRHLRSEVRASLTAGTGKFEDVTGPLTIAVEAGSAFVKGKLTEGNSEIRCTAGKIRIELEEGSDVQVVARSTLGKIQMPKGASEGDWAGVGGGKREMTLGNGKAKLSIEATTGMVTVDAPR